MWVGEGENMRKGIFRSNKKGIEGNTHQAANGLKAKHDGKRQIRRGKREREEIQHEDQFGRKADPEVTPSPRPLMLSDCKQSAWTSENIFI